jgi:nicotinate dehydrogenase subunit A
VTAHPAELRAIALRVNGRAVQVTAPPHAPLLYVLRNDLGLRAAKFGCGLEQCGACTVLVGGEPVLACSFPLSRLDGREVTTVEGLAEGGALHPVQRAFFAESAGQCAYCIPGILMETVALLAWNADPSDAEIRRALSSHLCRCGAHPRILRAVRRAAQEAARAEAGAAPAPAAGTPPKAAP